MSEKRAIWAATAVVSALSAVGFFWTWTLSLSHPHLRGEEPGALVVIAILYSSLSAFCTYAALRP